MISKRAIPKDSIIIAENIKKEPLINRGDKIKLMSEIGNVKVSTIAIAKDYGYKNDYVRVENIKSNKIVKAKIINKNLVIIE
jgi:flagella basal body P-ring formation protein FlgA